MNKLLSLLLTLFLFSSVYAEARVVDRLEYRDGIAYALGESEGFSGKLIITYSNGDKETEVNYKNGEKNGVEKRWHNNGQKKLVSSWKNSKKVGLETAWYSDGKKEFQTFHSQAFNSYSKGDKQKSNKNKKKNVKQESNIALVREFRDGIVFLPGASEPYTGQYVERFFYRSIKNSLQVCEKNNNVKESYQYKDGKLNGHFIGCRYNGNIETEGFYNNNKLDGLWTAYDEIQTPYQIKFYKGLIQSITPTLLQQTESSRHRSLFNPTIKKKAASYLWFSKWLKKYKAPNLSLKYLKKSAFLGNSTAAKNMYLLSYEGDKFIKLMTMLEQGRVVNNERNLALLDWITKNDSFEYYEAFKNWVVMRLKERYVEDLSSFGYDKGYIEKSVLDISNTQEDILLMLDNKNRSMPSFMFQPNKDIVESLKQEIKNRTLSPIILLANKNYKPRPVCSTCKSRHSVCEVLASLNLTLDQRQALKQKDSIAKREHYFKKLASESCDERPEFISISKTTDKVRHLLGAYKLTNSSVVDYCKGITGDWHYYFKDDSTLQIVFGKLSLAKDGNINKKQIEFSPFSTPPKFYIKDKMGIWQCENNLLKIDLLRNKDQLFSFGGVKPVSYINSQITASDKNNFVVKGKAKGGEYFLTRVKPYIDLSSIKEDEIREATKKVIKHFKENGGTNPISQLMNKDKGL